MLNNKLRIISGQYRKSVIKFYSGLKDLRPTSSYTRETVFNWISNKIYNKTVLDAFAGSGILGFESISRSCKSCSFVDKEVKVLIEIKKNILRLNISNAFIYKIDTIKLLQHCKFYDLIFLDPPYTSNLLEESLFQILQNQRITKETIIFIEHKIKEQPKIVQRYYKTIKASKIGKVSFSLISKK